MQDNLSPKMQTLMAIDAANKELQERNAIRLKEAKEKMGTKYLLHPANAMSREKFNKISRVLA